MSKRTAVICDNCGADDVGDSGYISVVTGMSSDGIEMTDDYNSIDLCTPCLTGLAKHLLNCLPTNKERKEILAKYGLKF